jgi:dihydrofolate synthase/folylpolyglutamate synthase
MNYPDLLQKLYQVNSFDGKKNGLKNCHRLDEIFQQPHQQFKSIHIAGTNGKGSVATMIATALQASGYKVGLFTSPHITCFRERICLNGERIPKQEVENLLSLIFEATQEHQIPATFFELTTFLAYLYFSKEKVDFAVIETGLGGRLDATNIIHPLLSIITSISLDHLELLGHTLSSITEEKAGIIKPNIPVIIGPKVSYEMIEKKAELSNSPLMQVKEEGMTFEIENQLIVKAALDFLGRTIALTSEAISQGLNAQAPCRFEIFSQTPFIILDAAHNPDGFESLFKALKIKFPDKKINVLFGLCKNKDISACASILAKHAQNFYPVEAMNGRGLKVEKLADQFKECGVDSDRIFCHPNLKESLVNATLEAAKKNEILLVCGTFFIMDEVKKNLKLILS